MVILACDFEVPGQAVDTCGQERDLDFGRTGVALSALEIGNDLRFFVRIREPYVLVYSLLSCFCISENADYTFAVRASSRKIMLFLPELASKPAAKGP